MAHLCLTPIVRELKISVMQGRVVTTLNIKQTPNILFSVVTYLRSLFFHFFFSFTMVRKERRAWWIILEEEGDLFSHWLYIGVCT